MKNKVFIVFITIIIIIFNVLYVYKDGYLCIRSKFSDLKYGDEILIKKNKSVHRLIILSQSGDKCEIKDSLLKINNSKVFLNENLIKINNSKDILFDNPVIAVDADCNLNEIFINDLYFIENDYLGKIILNLNKGE